MIKKALKIVVCAEAAVCAAIFAAWLFIQGCGAQTALAKALSSTVFDGTDASVTVGKVHIRPFNRLVVRDLTIVDRNPFVPGESLSDSLLHISGIDYQPFDTVVSVKFISASFSLEGLWKGQGLHLGKVVVKDADVIFVREPFRSSNFKRLFAFGNRKSTLTGNIFDARKLSLENVRFRMQSAIVSKPYDGGINWKDLDVSALTMEMQQLSLSDGVLRGTVNAASFQEKSGLRCRKMSSGITVGKGSVCLEDFHLSDRFSSISMPAFRMEYGSGGAFKRFTREVNIDAAFDPSRLSSSTLSYFIKSLKDIHLDVNLDGRLSGTVSDMSLDNLEVSTTGVSAVLDGNICGLPRFTDAELDLDINGLTASSSGLSTLLQSLPGEIDVAFINKMPADILMNASLAGRLDRLKVKADAQTSLGRVNLSASLDNLPCTDSPLEIDGKVNAGDIDLGAITRSRQFGKCSFESSLRSSLRNKDGNMLHIDTLWVDRLAFHGKDYRNMYAVGDISSNGFHGRIASGDSDCNFILSGAFALSPRTRNGVYQFSAGVGYADLHAMNFDKRERSSVSFATNVNFTTTSKGLILGDISLSGITFDTDDGKHTLDSVVVSSYSTGNKYKAKLTSPFLLANFQGTSPITGFIRDLKAVTVGRDLPSLLRAAPSDEKIGEYTFNLKCLNSSEILSIIKPGLYVDNKTTFTAEIKDSGNFCASLRSRRLALNDKYLKDIDLTADNRDDSLKMTMTFSQLSALSLCLDGNTLEASADNDRFSVHYLWNNNSGEIAANGWLDKVGGETRFRLSLEPSSFTVNSSTWNLSSANFLSSKREGLTVDSFTLSSGQQSINISGGYNPSASAALTAKVKNLDLSLLNMLMDRKSQMFGGILNGEAALQTSHNAKNISSDFTASDVTLFGSDLGLMKGRLDNSHKRLNFKLVNNLSGHESINVSGNYASEAKWLDVSAKLDGVDASLGMPFVKGVFSSLDGKISTNLKVSGPLRRLDVSVGEGKLENVKATVSYTHVPYLLDGPFHIDNTGVFFDKINLTDRYGNSGTVTGGLEYDSFTNLKFNTSISYNGVELLDMPETDRQAIYGTAAGTGTFAIRGPLRNLVLEVDVNSTQGGKLHIPVSSSLKGENSNILNFKQPQVIIERDPYEVMKESKTRRKSGIQCNINANISNNVEAFVELDKASGNVISGVGNGLLKIKTGRGQFDIKGDYALNSGNYKFVALGIASRDFTIQNGSSIKFNGNIMDSDLSIDALYRTKTSISTLIADTTSVSHRRTVNCIINITDKLKDPNLRFKIEVPDLDPSINSMVESALSTDDKVQKQFLSLILSNSFIPDEQSGIFFNNESVVYSNMSEIMAGQLSNILQKLDIPVDLGLKYQPNEKGNDMFDVAISTQLFNNRVLVNGNIGNKQYSSSTANDVVGDLDIEIKIDRSGALRLTLFSHSADQYTNYLDYSQRNGMGIIYQRDFNNVSELLKTLFASEPRRVDMDMKQRGEIAKQGVNTIVIK